MICGEYLIEYKRMQSEEELKAKTCLQTDRNFTSKSIKSIDSLISINEKIFELTERFASIKLSA